MIFNFEETLQEILINQKNYGSAKRVLCLTRSQYDANTFGGSSSATASFAAMAAVVWSKYPTYSATQLIAHLRNFASTGNSRASHTGWGVVNIDLATR